MSGYYSNQYDRARESERGRGQYDDAYSDEERYRYGRNYRDRTPLGYHRRGRDEDHQPKRRSRSPGGPVAGRTATVQERGWAPRDHVCMRCSTTGHWPEDCPIKTTCGNCGLFHAITTCPHPPRSRATASKLTRTSGAASPAPPTRGLSAPASASASSAVQERCTLCGSGHHDKLQCRCPFCGQPGHSSHDCAEKKGNEYCHECKGKGHAAKNCEKRIKRVSRKSIA